MPPFRLLLGAACVLAACKAGTEANLVDITGEWAFTELLEDRLHGFSCADTGVYRITQAGDRFEGFYIQRGACRTPTGIVDNSDAGLLSGGRVVGHTVRFMVTANCDYEGSADGRPAGMLAGRGVCVLQDVNRTLNFTGTWQATR